MSDATLLYVHNVQDQCQDCAIGVYDVNRVYVSAVMYIFLYIPIIIYIWTQFNVGAIWKYMMVVIRSFGVFGVASVAAAVATYIYIYNNNKYMMTTATFEKDK